MENITIDTFDSKQASIKKGVPEKISLWNSKTSYLELAGYCIDEFNYKLVTDHKYTPHLRTYNSYNTKLYRTIDIEDGPIITIGDIYDRMEVVEIAEGESGDLLIVMTYE